MVKTRLALSLVGLLVTALAWGICARPAQADHNIYLPQVPSTPLMQQVIAFQSYTYCFDERSSNYPNFKAHFRDVVAEYEARVGIKGTEVAGVYKDALTALAAGCQVWNSMPDNISCDGWAARVFYANRPVTIEYCWTLGYPDFRSAIGHELGHALLGLHEQYRDSGGVIQCTRRTDTVMDCGSGVRYPQPLDISRGCAIIKTTWCGKPPAPPPPPPPYESCTTYPGWEPSVSCYWPALGKWLWLIDATNGPQLWEWSTGPWRCSQRCP